jgi:hypothetical protein
VGQVLYSITAESALERPNVNESSKRDFSEFDW